MVTIRLDATVGSVLRFNALVVHRVPGLALGMVVVVSVLTVASTGLTGAPTVGAGVVVVVVIGCGQLCDGVWPSSALRQALV